MSFLDFTKLIRNNFRIKFDKLSCVLTVIERPTATQVKSLTTVATKRNPAEWWGKRRAAYIKTNFQNFKTLETNSQTNFSPLELYQKFPQTPENTLIQVSSLNLWIR